MTEKDLHPRAAQVAAVLARTAPGAEVRQLAASTRTAREAAEAVGCEVGAIASSLVFMSDDGPVLVVTSGAHRVDLDLLAATTGLTGLRRASPEEVRTATGQAIGGVSPVGHPEPLRTLVDEDLGHYETVWAAAGTPHAVFSTSLAELVSMTSGKLVRVARDTAGTTPAIARTPPPPYVAVIFTSLRTPGDNGYEQVSSAMHELARSQDGYLGFESARESLGITVSYWRDEAAARAWKRVGEHLLAQKRGRDEWYSDYRVRVATVSREYGGQP